MKILFLTSRLPYPPFRGDKLKIYNLIREVSRYHEVILLSFVQNRDEEQWLPELRKYCSRIRVVRHSILESVLQCLRGIVGNDPFQVCYFKSARMRKALAEILSSERPDIIHTHLIRMAPYTAEIPSLPRLLDLTDAVSLYLDRFRAFQRNLFIRWILSVEHERMVLFEAILCKFDRTAVCSEIDRRILLKHAPSSKISLLWNGIDLEAFSSNGTVAQEAGRIIFTGNMSYFPNADAAKYFVRKIFPLIKQNVPNAKIFIVGQNPSNSTKALAGTDVVVTGFVQDITTEYLKSSVAVSPVRFGAGTFNKVLEPLALGVPVVATPVSVEGLNLQDGTEILVAEDPVEFAEAVVNVLLDSRLKEKLSRGAKERVRSLYGWNTVAGHLNDIYREIHSDV